MFVDTQNRASGEAQQEIVNNDKISLEAAEAQVKALADAQKKLAREQASKQDRVKSAQDKARAIKAILQQKLNDSINSPEVTQHIERAISSCDACLHASDSENAHDVTEEHLNAAHGHVHNAKEEHHKSAHNKRGHHTQPPELVGLGVDLPPSELPQHH